MRHGNYHAQKTVPCDCGSRDAYWHGQEHGERVYCCDACWRKSQARANEPRRDVKAPPALPRTA